MKTMKTKYPLVLWNRDFKEDETEYAFGFPIECDRDWGEALPDLLSGSCRQVGIIPRGVTVTVSETVGEVAEFYAGRFLISSRKWVLAPIEPEYEPGKTVHIKSERR